MMPDLDLKEFIALKFENIKMEVSRLTGMVEHQSSQINDIQIKMTTRVAELQKDIEDLRKDVVDIKGEARNVNESQKLKWKTLNDERNQEKKSQSEKEIKQGEINQSIIIINRLLWLILGIVLSVGIGFVWSLIVNGGVKGIVP